MLLIIQIYNIRTEITYLAYYEVVHPITRSAKSDAVWTIGKRPNFGDDNPCTGTPRVCKVDDEQPDQGDGSPTSGYLVRPIILIFSYKNGYDNVAVDYISNMWITDDLN